MTSKIILSLAAVLSLSLPSENARAAAYCSEPSAPFCVNSFGTYDDEWSFERCKSQVESYISDVEDYIDCLDREKIDVTDEANKTIERFNCKARKGTYCF